ncbi:MAG: YjjW family glycine radical enzyme activase [Chloroflexi bacterium]|nr:YjjW family glycine radical enzyme activase [Chloroflexota bacterium]
MWKSGYGKEIYVQFPGYNYSDMKDSGSIAIVNRLLTHSLVDGPGNRAVVFMQGCNLRCSFCHNPYTLSLCNHCGACVPACPAGALKRIDGCVEWDESLCRECDTCIQACPNFSTPRTHSYTAGELWYAIQPFAPFLAGVTVSGGEPMLQAEFLMEFFTLVKKESQLSTFIETNGMTGPERIKPLLPLLDGAMVDLKVFDSEKHRRLTGSPNEKVKQTIRDLSAEGKLYAVRQTVIPGVNDDDEGASAMARFLAGINPAIRLRFLRFRAHGTRGEAQGWSSPEDDTLNRLVQAAKNQGLPDVEHSI